MPGLDGWRAIAIIGVMFDHDYTYHVGSHSMQWGQDFGGTFVVLFFAISGFLICTRILEEEALLGRLNLRGFYIRRIFRIQPAAIVYLAGVALVSLIGWMHQDWKYWFGAIFLFRNYQINVLVNSISANGHLTGHFWTLAVEEHFYLLLSLVLYFTGRRRLFRVSLLVVAAFLWPHISQNIFPQSTALSAGRHTGMQLPYLVLPAFLAIIFRRAKPAAWASRWLKPGATIAFSIVFVSLSILVRAGIGDSAFLIHPALGLILPHWPEGFFLFWPFWIAATVSHPESWTTRFLELPLMKWVGRLSYSLYLWHVMFFRGTWPSSIPQDRSPLLYLTHAPWNFLAAFAFAAGSFYLIERPFMRLGHRLAPPATPGREDLQDEPSIDGAIESHIPQSEIGGAILPVTSSPII